MQRQFLAEIGKGRAVLPDDGGRFCLLTIAVVVEFAQYPFPFFGERVFDGMNCASFGGGDP